MKALRRGDPIRIYVQFRPNFRLLEPLRLGLLLMTMSAVAFGCSKSPESSAVVELDLESRRPGQMAEFFLGAYGTPEQVSSVLGDNPGESLNLDSLRLFAPDLAGALEEATQAGRVSRESFAAAIASTYGPAADLPADVDALWAELGGRPTGGGDRQNVEESRLLTPSWVTYEVTGSMTEYRRRIHIRRDAVRAALEEYSDSASLRYPVGTTVIGEHLQGGEVVETTLMRRRGDGFWSFGAYDARGVPTDSIAGSPDPLGVPGDCFGCHYGSRLFEPERSFPAAARPGPAGERAVHVGEALRSPEVVTLLQEHARRTDGLLGLPATLYLTALLDGRSADSVDAALVRAFR